MSRPCKIVFVGNIPWDATEEDMMELFGEPGPLVSFRLVVDKDTLKPRGYGFAEYYDVETAKSAVRNLNDMELSGRKLRVNFADNNDNDQDNKHGGQQDYLEKAGAESLTNVSGTPLAPGQSATDAISKVIDGMTQEQQLDMLANMKLLSSTQPEQATALLSSNPQLAYCLMLMMLTCGLIEPTAIQRIVKSMAAPAGPPPVASTAAQSAYGAGFSSGSVAPPQPAVPPSMPAPPAATAAYAPAGLASGVATMSEQQRQLLAQVFSLSQQQIDALPPDQRATVMQLRSQFAQFQGLMSPSM